MKKISDILKNPLFVSEYRNSLSKFLLTNRGSKNYFLVEYNVTFYLKVVFIVKTLNDIPVSIHPKHIIYELYD